MTEPAPRISPIARLVLAGGAAVGALGVGAFLGLAMALLFLAGCVLVGVISLVWSSVQSLTGETPLSLEEAMDLGAPSVEEERKRAVLRALKDLEFERSVGKISEEDYHELSARYRAEAKALLRALDKDLAPLRKKAERLLERRLQREGLTDTEGKGEQETQGESKPVDPDNDADAKEAAEKKEEPLDGRACAQCGTDNDADARFCKRCGKTLAVVEEQAV